jgi:hydroxymethylpyrimidine/phosphomethylpyrimidine kinase
MRKVAMTIAGSDSGGGAGLQADLKTFEVCGVHGTTVVTGVTAQSPLGVKAVQAIDPALVKAQFDVVMDELTPVGLKTGALFNDSVVSMVSDCLKRAVSAGIWIIVDPVMVATSGSRLLDESALEVFFRDLLPQASLVTPNIPEAEILVGHEITDTDQMRSAAREIHDRFGVGTLVKGGHLSGPGDVVDIFFDGKEMLEISGSRVTGKWTHGTGCTMSAAITGYLCAGSPLEAAIRGAKHLTSRAIAGGYQIGRHGALNPFAD